MVGIRQNRALKNRLFLWLMRGIAGSLGAIAFILLLTLAVYAEALENVDTRKQATEAGSPLFQTDLDQPATTVEDWIAQIEGFSAQGMV